jgi:hypothetical protein
VAGAKISICFEIEVQISETSKKILPEQMNIFRVLAAKKL